ALAGPKFMIPASVGKQVGSNLFESFNQFNLKSTQSATFMPPATVPGSPPPPAVQNILARVTRGPASSIDGIINSDIEGANLFFLNPYGVMFGPHAQLNVTGSVAISTANYLKMADGGRFNAKIGDDGMLSSAPVRAFGFLNTTPAAVVMDGRSEEHTSELQSLAYLVCRLLLE